MSMDNSNLLAEIKRNLRHELNRDNVKLWLPPFTTATGEKGENPSELIEKYSASLTLAKDVIALALEDLRQHAAEKFFAKKRFQETGEAQVTVHISGTPTNHGRQLLKCQIHLQTTAAEFKKSLKEDLPEDLTEIKLIFKGKILEDDKNFESQHVTNNSHLMAICISKAQESAREEEMECDKINARIESIKKLTDILSKREDAGKGKHQKFYLEINDQNGKPLELPQFERQSLSKAMALNELGRNLIKSKAYPEALLLLLEAEDAFSYCRSSILTAVDNYGVLCMDIVWCYLHMKNLQHLPDAERKLKTCRDCLQKSYGSQLERATSLKGSSASVSALYVRLNLLEGVIAFLKGNYNASKSSLDMAEEEIKTLRVDDSKLSQLIMMGFTSQESRLALRSCRGDVTSAVNHIATRREEKKQRKEEERKKNEKWKLSRKLGKTSSGDWVNVENYEYLISMGFPAVMASAALRHANNSLNNALQLIENNPELLTIEDKRSSGAQHATNIPDESITQLMSMGFDYEMSRRALCQSDCDVVQAANALIANNGVLPSSSTDQGETSSDSTSSDQEEDMELEKQIAETMDGFTEEEEDYLDSSFVEEVSLISEYRALMDSLLTR